MFLIGSAAEARASGRPVAELAREVCGDWFDGLLLLGPAVPAGAAARTVLVLNRDGSEGGACLNGARVVALLELEASGILEMGGRRLRWARTARTEPAEAGAPVRGEVELHLPGESFPDPLVLQPLTLEDGTRGVAVNFWNPHCVIPVPTVHRLDLARIAAEVGARTDLFPDGVNVEVVADGDAPGRVRMRVWERGVGETRACGSGAVATALAWWQAGAKGALHVAMPGGVLRVAEAEDGGVLVAGACSHGRDFELPLA